jgi:DNA (cytosine-5)-methyltransferase 1
MMDSLSLFTGIGGFDLGFERAGINVSAMCESDAQARNVLSKHWPDVPIFDDVKDIDGKQFGAIDVISGGFPCQDISVAGNRKGLEGERSGLWWEFYRIISEAKPKWVVIENVAGLMSSGGRRDLGAIIGSLGKLGYLGGYRVLDARYFGVAQRRRRMFIVASFGNDGGGKVLFESESLPGDLEASRQTWQKVAGSLRSGTKRSGSITDELDGHGSHVLVNAEEGFQVATPIGSEPDFSFDCVPFAENQRSEVIYTDLPTVNTGGGKPGQGYPAVLTGNDLKAYSVTPKTGGGNNLRATEISQSNSLTALGQHHDRGTKILDVANLRVRRITPTECERLMGFPDGWTAVGADGKAVSDTARYRFCGNAVVVSVAKWLGERILSVH